MKIENSPTSSLIIYVIGLGVGSMFGFITGILFIAIAYLIKKLMANKEKDLDHSNSTTDNKANSSADVEEPIPSFQA